MLPADQTLPEPASPRAPDRRRRRPRPISGRSRLPVSIRYGVPVLVLVLLGVLLWDHWVRSHATLVLRGEGGAPLPRAVLSFYTASLSPALPSPPPLLGEMTLEGTEQVRLGPDLVPGRALVRVVAEGHGTGFTVAELGSQPVTWVAGPPGRIEGTVRTPSGPATGARVLLFGGGSRGVVLAEGVAGDDGRFSLQGFDARLESVTVRALLARHAVADVSRWRQEKSELVLDLQPTRPIEGRVVLPAELPRDGLLVLARAVPGPQAALDRDGAFALDHVPPGTRPRLLVYGLPEDYTHGVVRAAAGDRDVVIEVQRASTVRGFVVWDINGVPIPGADVFLRAGPTGIVGARCDIDGAFEIGRVPPGTQVLTAQVPIPGAEPDEPQFRTATREIVVREGEPLANIMIRVP